MSLITAISSAYAGPPTVPGYVLDEFLGSGPSGSMWAATTTGSVERVAVRMTTADRPVDELVSAAEWVSRLGDRVESVHLVRVRDQVVLEDGSVAVVLDLAEGGSLRDVVTIRGAVPLGELVTALTPVASVLAELHGAGVVHADVAPGNVLFTGDGRPLLGDLSSARLIEQTWPAPVVGTPGFLAPEL